MTSPLVKYHIDNIGKRYTSIGEVDIIMKNITVVDNHPPDKYRDLHKENIFSKIQG